MEMESMKQAYLEAEKNGITISAMHMTFDEIIDICIAEYKKKYNVDMMDSIKLAEEIDELMTALSSIHRNDTATVSWHKSDKWFNLLEELEDVDIMVGIVNKVLNTQLNTNNELYDENYYIVNNTAYFIRELGLKNQLVLKGVRKQFNQETVDEGRRIVQGCLNKIYSIGIALQYKFGITPSDISRMRYVKTARLLKKYGYDV